ncbi:hypothetical protein BGI41_03400 [Methanobrevibacter sp. 87.7]|uniref:DUF371 domain-containing protein n=1 Tax=Methanobrevibacter sp. 87.7 TaxID=387957 RepID=UPI000B5044E2|nr:DUF371 domain-containing protein [Methanobrevibacter sp. 87.7]OWT33238.1 hypothetical protein BGI41_03400 [Methanobrevibacter sp. 87.7]
MDFKIKAKGHPNVTAMHKSTFEITKDQNLTKSGDCIIGLDINKSMLDFPEDFKNKLRNSDTKVIVKLKTENASYEIIGYGHPDLPLNHPTDLVCRKSDFVCSRTLMIKANKASSDLNRELIKDLEDSKDLFVDIILE